MTLTRLLSVVTTIVLVVAISCETEKSVKPDQISDATLIKIGNLGFSTQGVYRSDGGYIIEGDIFLSERDLSLVPTSPRLVIANVEQYNTFNLVTSLPRVITVSSSGNVPASVSSAIDGAIARYNAQNLQLTFQRVSNSGDINVQTVNGGSYIASSGFPTSGGDPYGTVKFNKKYANYSSGFLITVLAHEMGHCIGFRHTDYMNRAYSCGSGGNEGQETTGVGAVHIPGTPTGPDSGSWMLACLSSTTDRPFNSNDRTALNYLY